MAELEVLTVAYTLERRAIYSSIQRAKPNHTLKFGVIQMQEKLSTDLVNKVISASIDGGSPREYRVVFTAERVMLVFGQLPGEHREALQALISRQTDGKWKDHSELASMIGAELVVGLPELVEKLAYRFLIEASMSGEFSMLEGSA